MAMIAIPVPESVGRLFRSIEVPGERDNSDHITMFYLGDNLSINKIVKIIPVVYKLVSELEPFLITTRKIVTFPKGDKGYPVIAPVEGANLHEIRKKLKRAFDSKGIEYNNKFPEYKPHVTLSYSKKKPKHIRLPKTQWQVNEIAIYGGDSCDEKIFVKLPLGLKIIERKAAYIDQLASLYKKSI